ncbi:oligosaccharide flippase family protein [Myxococcota bacterium]|nr:oligosaccharide flippase family protein [Myxococcota bacterium]
MTAPSPVSSGSEDKTPKGPAGPTMKKRTLSSSLTTLAGTGGGTVIRLASNLILTRLLFPEFFGIMAIVNLVLIGLMMVSDLGTRVSVVQNPRGDEPDFLNTAWTVEILRGTLLFLIGSAVAYPAAKFYGHDELMWLIPASAINPLILGFQSTKIYQMQRHISLGRNVAIDIFSQLVGFAVTVSHAYVYRSVYSLVTGPAATSVTKALLTHFMLPKQVPDVRTGKPVALVDNHFRWEPGAANALIRTGRWIFVSTMITFVAQRIDTMMLGKLMPADTFGVYGIAMILATLPMNFAGPVVNFVLLPALADAHRQSHDVLIQRLTRARRIVMPAGLFAILGVALFAPAFFGLLYDHRYHDAGWIAQLYMVMTWFQFETESFGRALQARDDSRTIALSNLTRTIVGAAGCYFGFQLDGLAGALVGTGLGAASGYLVIYVALKKLDLSDGAADLRYTLGGLALGVAGHYGSSYVVAATGLPEAWVALGVGVALFTAPAAFGARRILREIRNKG